MTLLSACSCHAQWLITLYVLTLLRDFRGSAAENQGGQRQSVLNDFRNKVAKQCDRSSPQIVPSSRVEPCLSLWIPFKLASRNASWCLEPANWQSRLASRVWCVGFPDSIIRVAPSPNNHWHLSRVSRVFGVPRILPNVWEVATSSIDTVNKVLFVLLVQKTRGCSSHSVCTIIVVVIVILILIINSVCWCVVVCNSWTYASIDISMMLHFWWFLALVSLNVFPD